MLAGGRVLEWGYPKQPVGVPWPLFKRLMEVLKSLNGVTVNLLAGHPSRLDLNPGHTDDGTPVSQHNADCDRQCQHLAGGLIEDNDAKKSCPTKTIT